MKKLYILHAGCVADEVKMTVALFNSSNESIQAVSSGGGSVDCIRSMLKGEPCDVLISADNALFEIMLMPERVSGYQVFAGNSMVVMSESASKPISDDNWKETLLSPEITFGHNDPHGDPGGYRAVMACMLADTVEQGLSRRLLGHVGRRVLASNYEKRPDYMFYYMSGAIKKGAVFARLPDSMNLSDPNLDGIYSSASFDLDGNGKNIVRGASIEHAITIPSDAAEPAYAMRFIDLFLQIDFELHGFIERRRRVGDWDQNA